MYKCKNCKFFDKISSEDYGTCIAWGYGKSYHSTYSKCYACDYFELQTNKNFDNGVEKSRN